MKRLTFDGCFCDIAQCRELPCPYDGMCSQRKVWERLKEYEDTGLSPNAVEKSAEIENKLSKVGDTVWVTGRDNVPREMELEAPDIRAVCTKIEYSESDIGYMIRKRPTVDAVEVVRCKDCKHRHSDSWCEYVDDDDNFYCARGERNGGAD